MTSICSIDGCSNAANGARGWCRKHYRRWQRNGDPEVVTHPERAHEYAAPAPPEQRFWEKVNKDGPVSDHRPDLGPCWIWTGGLRGGYGRLWLTRLVHVEAHRFVYELIVGPIPSGDEAGYRVTIDHLCRVPACVNPEHLEIVSHQENCRRGLQGSMITHCPRGHLYDEANTGFIQGHRRCLTCHRESTRARRALARVA